MTAVAETGTPPEQPDDGRVGISIDGRELRVPEGNAGARRRNRGRHPHPDLLRASEDGPGRSLPDVPRQHREVPEAAAGVRDGRRRRAWWCAPTSPRSPSCARGCSSSCSSTIRSTARSAIAAASATCRTSPSATGPGSRGFRSPRRSTSRRRSRSREHIELDQERCILCWRCVRYYDEITGEKEIVLQQRGVDTLVSTFDDRQLESKFQGNLPEVCPVGALTHREYRFVSRPWDLQRTASICPECSYGCNINVDSRDFEVRRFASRDNPLVDDMWLCDRGRYSFDRWNTLGAGPPPGRPHRRRVARRLRARGDHPGGTAACVRSPTSTAPSSIGVLGSSASTNEELFLLERLARQVIGTPHVDHQLDAVRRPLRRGARARHRGDRGLRRRSSCSAPSPRSRRRCSRFGSTRPSARTARASSGWRATSRSPTLSPRPTGATRIGLIADETNRAHAAGSRDALALRLGAPAHDHARHQRARREGPRPAPERRPRLRLASTKPGKNGRQILEGLAAGEMRGARSCSDPTRRSRPMPTCSSARCAKPRASSRFDTRPGHRVAVRDGALPRPRDLREGRQRHQRRGARAAHPRRPAAG